MKKCKWSYTNNYLGDGYFWPNSPKKPEVLSALRTQASVARIIYLCDTSLVENAVFKREDFDNRYMPPDDMYMGVASKGVQKFLERGDKIIQSWDTAFSASSSADYAVCVTGMYIPCDKYLNGEDEVIFGPCEPYNLVYILDVFRKKLTFHENVQEVRYQFMKWKPEKIVIEKATYGSPILETLESSGIPLEAAIPVVGKYARVMQNMGAGNVQGWYRCKRVCFPTEAEWLEPFISEHIDFTGERGGRDDQVDACTYLIQDAIKSGTTGGRLPTGFGEAMKADENKSEPFGLRDNTLLQEDPNSYIQRMYFDGAKYEMPARIVEFQEKLMRLTRF